MPCSQTPGKIQQLATLRWFLIDFRKFHSVIFPVNNYFEALSLQLYSLRPAGSLFYA
jgi:hypothetical protein